MENIPLFAGGKRAWVVSDCNEAIWRSGKEGNNRSLCGGGKGCDWNVGGNVAEGWQSEVTNEAPEAK